jgi:hypothetical protein
MRKREAKWKETSDSWETAPTNSVVGWDVPEDDPRGDWQASNTKLFMTVHAVSRGWPSVAGGVEVSVEVRSNAEDIVEECTACRCFVFILICSFNLISRLYYSSVGTSNGSCISARPCR